MPHHASPYKKNSVWAAISFASLLIFLMSLRLVERKSIPTTVLLSTIHCCLLSGVFLYCVWGERSFRAKWREHVTSLQQRERWTLMFPKTAVQYLTGNIHQTTSYWIQRWICFFNCLCGCLGQVLPQLWVEFPPWPIKSFYIQPSSHHHNWQE